MARRTPWLVGSAVAAVVLYLALWIGFARQWGWLTAVDDTALALFHRHGADHPGWVLGWDVFCLVLGPGPVRVGAAVVIVLAFIRRNTRLAVFLLLTVEGSALVTETAKLIADRPRPDTAFVSALSTSFPSGHALGVLVSVLALLTVVLPPVRPSHKAWLIALGAVVVVTIGIGRVVLNVHHPSDVVAGWALGWAYFVFCVLVVPPTRPITEPDETPEALDTAR
ncbi:phosphatase PAP2 family protein [Mycolicibacterium phlei]